MKVVIIINSLDNSNLAQATRLKEECDKRSISCEIIRNSVELAYVSNGKAESKVIADAIIYLDKDVNMARLLEKAGHLVINSSRAIEICDSKIKTHVELSGRGVNMPDTLISTLVYDKDIVNIKPSLDYAIGKLGLPFIIKSEYGSFGSSVYLVKSKQEAEDTIALLNNNKYLMQKYISSSAGRDVRIIVIGGKVVSFYERYSTQDFRSNIELGGMGRTIELSDTFVRCAEKVADVLKLDYCGLDFLIGENNEPILCEVNSNALFAGAESITKINVAEAYINHVIDKIRGRY